MAAAAGVTGLGVGIKQKIDKDIKKLNYKNELDLIENIYNNNDPQRNIKIKNLIYIICSPEQGKYYHSLSKRDKETYRDLLFKIAELLGRNKIEYEKLSNEDLCIYIKSIPIKHTNFFSPMRVVNSFKDSAKYIFLDFIRPGAYVRKMKTIMEDYSQNIELKKCIVNPEPFNSIRDNALYLRQTKTLLSNLKKNQQEIKTVLLEEGSTFFSDLGYEQRVKTKTFFGTLNENHKTILKKISKQLEIYINELTKFRHKLNSIKNIKEGEDELIKEQKLADEKRKMEIEEQRILNEKQQIKNESEQLRMNKINHNLKMDDRRYAEKKKFIDSDKNYFDYARIGYNILRTFI